MPCYTEWNACLDKDSEEYRSNKAECEAKLKTIKHILLLLRVAHERGWSGSRMQLRKPDPVPFPLKACDLPFSQN